MLVGLAEDDMVTVVSNFTGADPQAEPHVEVVADDEQDVPLFAMVSAPFESVDQAAPAEGAHRGGGFREGGQCVGWSFCSGCTYPWLSSCSEGSGCSLGPPALKKFICAARCCR